MVSPISQTYAGTRRGRSSRFREFACAVQRPPGHKASGLILRIYVFAMAALRRGASGVKAALKGANRLL
jgi:hypothetical protein